MSDNLRGRVKFKKFKPMITFLIKFYSLLPRKIRNKLFVHYRMTKGIKGLVLRYVLLKSIALHCGDNISIHPGVYLFKLEKLSIGNNVSIHPMCYIDATGGIEIKDDVSIAHSTTLMSTEHNFDDRVLKIKDQGIKHLKTVIESDVWIGAGCRILGGTIIEEGSIIAAGAVVKNRVKNNSVYGGIPAKLIKER